VWTPLVFIVRDRLTLSSAYAVYFDYKRRNDPTFRKELKKQSKRQARVAKEAAEAKEEGFPTDVEEREAYFMQEVARGEGLSSEGLTHSKGRKRTI